MAIGERIRWFRKRHGLTQRELGLKLGFTNKTADLRIRQYETGLRNPKELPLYTNICLCYNIVTSEH